MYSSSASFDSVVIIESLEDGELKTGRDLFETVMAPANFRDPGLVAELYQRRTKDEVINVLRHIARVTRTHGRSPIVQLEMHGSKEGFVLASGERLGWMDLAALLSEINYASRLNLIVVAAMCYGWYMIDILRPTDRAPAFGIIGPPDEIPSSMLLSANQRFYERLLVEPHDLKASIDAANSELSENNAFRIINAELMLCRIYSHYVAGLTTEETQTERVNRLVTDIARVRNLDVHDTMVLREQIRSNLDDHSTWFDHYRSRFLMLDDFPDNERRFQLRYEDCARIFRPAGEREI